MEYKTQDIKIGKFQNNQWKRLNGLESIETTLERIKTEIDWSDYELWIHGGITCDVDTYDIDMSIIGPMKPKRIMYLLEQVHRIGFEEQTLPDVKYISSYKDLETMVATNKDLTKTVTSVCYRGKITIDGKPYNYGKIVNNLWIKEQKFPMSKTLDAMEKGRVYKAPMKLI
tara:strand:- start:795 stop:1307 length:513 start_codon:yes stop_codon:yes gene_type:complete